MIQRAAQVDVEDGVVVFRLDVHDLQRLGDAGIVDQHVDRAELGHDLLHRGEAGGLVGDVAGEADDAFAEVGGRGLRLRLVEIENDDPAAVLANRARWRGRCRAPMPPR